MQKMKKLCLALASLLAISCMATSCQYISPFLDYFSSQESALESSSSLDSSFQNSSTLDSSSNAEEIPPKEETPPQPEYVEEHLRLVDEAYALPYNGAMSGTHTLVGVVTEIVTTYTSKNGVTLIMAVYGRENKPIQCYRLTGTGADVVGVGDTITVTGTLKNYKGTVEFDKGCVLNSFTAGNTQTPYPDDNDPYANVNKTEFYANYTPATSNEDAYYRSLHGLMSGSVTTPDQAPVISAYQPTANGKFIRNSEMLYEENGDAYVVVNAYGEEAYTIYRSGAYIAIDEVAAYVYAFGTYPKNYTTSKNTSPSASIWGEYLRLNHTKFSGSTTSYPYEPELPNITGCGGRLQYYEMDIGTTGTDCDPSYVAKLYNNGNTITRGAARIVYGKNDLNNNGIYEIGELHVFYTYNHYNDFQEYLNYAGGWGEKFGNITGGGTISSKTDYNPTDYVQVSLQTLPMVSSIGEIYNGNFQMPIFAA